MPLRSRPHAHRHRTRRRVQGRHHPKPFIHANRAHNAPKSLEEPVPTATTAHGGGSFLIEAEVQPFVLGQQSGATARATEEPVATIADADAVALVKPTIIHYYGQSYAPGRRPPSHHHHQVQQARPGQRHTD